MMDGTGEIQFGDSSEEGGARTESLVPGQFAYYPAWTYHTIRNCSDRAITYLMFKWCASDRQASNNLNAGVQDFRPLAAVADDRPFAPSVLIEAPTRYLEMLHCHLTRLAPGAGYGSHVDGYDVALVVFDGTIETAGHSVKGPGVVYFEAGQPHGMINPAASPATYLVFEFHTT